jgi:hypothetical protein
MGAPTISRNSETHSDIDLRVKPHEEDNMKLTTIALASALALSSTFAPANAARHRLSVRTYHLHMGIPLFRSGFSHRTYGIQNGPAGVSAGGLMSNGRSASEFGGE